MKKIIIPRINNTIVLEDNITIIAFEDQLEYRTACFNLFDNIIYSEDDKTKDIAKKGLLIDNPYNLEINQKKFLTAFYKRQTQRINDKTTSLITEIYQKIVNLLEEVSLDTDTLFDFEEDITLQILLNAISIQFKEINKENYLEYLVNYIKLNQEYTDIDIIISYNLTNILTEEELNLLKTELKVLDLHLVDLKIQNKNIKSNNITIDKDWCII